MMTKIGFVCLISGGIASVACTSETNSPPELLEAPEAIVDSLDERDQGTSYNGWTQSGYASYCPDYGITTVSHQLSRSFGDATRGGGGCLVQWTGEACSADASCTTSAKAAFGAAAYGYCYSGSCYSRPGGGELCVMNPNRPPGALTGGPIFGTPYIGWNVYMVGCMTKTAGLNAACGSMDPNAGVNYMRTMIGANVGWCAP